MTPLPDLDPKDPKKKQPKQPPLVHRGHKPIDIGAPRQWMTRRGNWYVQVIEQFVDEFLAGTFLFQNGSTDESIRNSTIFYARGTTVKAAQRKLYELMGWESLDELEEVEYAG